MWIASALASVLTARRGSRPPMAAGCVLAGAGLLLVDAYLNPDAGIASLGWALALTGFGFGMTFVAMTAAAAVPPRGLALPRHRA